MIKNRAILASVIVAIISWLVAYWYEPSLPELVPTHWNASGEVDGYTAKPWGVYMMPMVVTGMVLLLALLPKISPKGFKLDEAKRIYDLIILIMSLFMTGVMVLSFESALNKDLDMNNWIMFGIGGLFIVLGNYLSKVPKNFFLGIRTPWTLSSDKVWYATHRMGSWCFVLAGLAVVILTIFKASIAWVIAALMFGSLLPVFYSLYAYHKLEGFNKKES